MDRSRLVALLLPPGASALVHIVLLALVAAASFTAAHFARRDAATGDLIVSIENPAALAEPAPPQDSPGHDAPGLPRPAALAQHGAEGALAVPPIVLTPAVAPSPASAPGLDMRRAVPPGAAFAGLSAQRVRRIVYVVDVSGPMASSLQFVLEEVARSVARLDPSQHMAVVLFREGIGDATDRGVLSMPAEPRLIPSSPANRAALAQFLSSVRPGGRSNPLAGLRTALALEPDVIFLLARGISRTGPDARWGEGRDAILAALDALNPPDSRGRRPVAIKTIQFIDDDPTGLMQAIAEIHGRAPGSYTRRSLEDFTGMRDRPAVAVAPPDPNLERAASMLWELSVSRADLRTIFGLASAAERDGVRRGASQALLTLASVTPDPGGGDELLPLLRARALVLRAATEDTARAQWLDAALDTLDTDPGAPAEVLATAATAHALRMAPGDADRAESLALRTVEIDPATPAALEARLAAILALAGDPARARPWAAELAGSLHHPPASVAGRVDAPLVLLALGAAARARLIHAATPADAQEALTPHLSWARSARPGLPPEAVLAAAGEALGPDAPLDEIDPHLALGRGLYLLPPPGEIPGRECLIALDIAAARAEPPEEGAIAVGESASIRAAMAISIAASRWPGPPEEREDARIDAVWRLDRALRDFPARSWRRDAALHILTHTGALLGAGADATYAAPRRRALEILILEDPRPDARADQWRLELAQRVAESDLPDPEARALDILTGPWIDEPRTQVERLTLWILSRRIARLGESLATAQHDRDAAAVRTLATEIAASARRAIPLAVRRQDESPALADALRADLAEALIALRSREAADIYEQLRARRTALGLPDGRHALGHARALAACGDDGAAFAVLRDLTGSMPQPADADPGLFWHAWTITLEILAARAGQAADEQARRTAAAHTLRLHDLDPALGGEPWNSRLRAVGLAVGVALPYGDPPVHSAP